MKMLAFNGSILVGDGEVVLVASSVACTPVWDEAKTLIEAAADLLAIAEKLTEKATAFISAWEFDHDADGEDLMAELKAAIAKARQLEAAK